MRVLSTALVLLLATIHVHARQLADVKPGRSQKLKDKKPQARKDTPNAPLQLSVGACKLLYLATSVNPALSVAANEYRGIWFRRGYYGKSRPSKPVVDQIYGAFFYFARLKPRLLFVVGACLRALQTSTVIQLVFDPGAGVGAGLNLLAWLVSSQWPSPLVLGWAASKPVWRLLRAAPPRRDVRFPISVGATGWWSSSSSS